MSLHIGQHIKYPMQENERINQQATVTFSSSTKISNAASVYTSGWWINYDIDPYRPTHKYRMQETRNTCKMSERWKRREIQPWSHNQKKISNTRRVGKRFCDRHGTRASSIVSTTVEYVNKWTNGDENELEPQVITYAKQRGNGSGNSSHNANKAIEAFVRWP